MANCLSFDNKNYVTCIAQAFMHGYQFLFYKKLNNVKRIIILKFFGVENIYNNFIILLEIINRLLILVSFVKWQNFLIAKP